MKKIFYILITFLYLNFCFIQPLHAESFAWPSSGYIGWLYAYNTQTAEGTHTGIDIWSNTNGQWNNNNQIGNGNPVYSAYGGTVVYKGDNPSTGDGYIIYHSQGLYTAYWHVANKQKVLGNSVAINEYIGNQTASNPNGLGSASANAVHLHFTVLSSGRDSYSNSKDPSNYLGRQLKYGQTGAPGWLNTYVNAGVSGLCNGQSVIIQNQNISGSLSCAAGQSITILPYTSIVGGNIRFYIQ